MGQGWGQEGGGEGVYTRHFALCTVLNEKCCVSIY